MKKSPIFILYAGIILYAAINLVLGEYVSIITIRVGFGLPIIPYLIIEWIVTPLVVAYSGFQSRWSKKDALCVGLPLFVLYTVVTPVVSSGGWVPVPWLSVFSQELQTVLPIISTRLLWWGGLYSVAYLWGMFVHNMDHVGGDEHRS